MKKTLGFTELNALDDHYDIERLAAEYAECLTSLARRGDSISYPRVVAVVRDGELSVRSSFEKAPENAVVVLERLGVPPYLGEDPFSEDGVWRPEADEWLELWGANAEQIILEALVDERV